MTLKVADFETGPEGAALSGNAQGGNSGALQITTNSGSAVFAKDVVRSGALGARFISAANALCIGRFASAATNNVLSVGVVFTHRPAPSPLTGVLSLRHSGGVAGRINWNPDNSLSLVDATLGNTLTIATGLSPGTAYELTVRARSATSTTGTVTAVLYSAAGVELGRASSSSYNVGTNPLAAVDVGIINTNPAAGTVVAIDYLQLDDGNTAELRAPQTAPTYSGTAALTGVGTLTGAGSPTTAASAALSGSGTLAGTGTPQHTGTAALVASGTLAGAGSPLATGTGAASSTGTLAADGTPTTHGQASLTGTGALSGTGVPRFTGTADLAGAGKLDAQGQAIVAAAIALAAQGTLTGAGQPTFQGTRAFDADGALTAAGAPAAAGIAALTGVGTLAGWQTAELHDITVTATLGPRRYGSTLGVRRTSSSLGSRRWESHL